MNIIVRLFFAAALVLASMAPAAAQSVPSGSYQQSCVNIRMQGNTLSAQCTAPNGRYISSSINAYSCNGGISNSNGYLRCNGGGGGGGGFNPAPGGSYQSSCINIRTYGNQLSAACTAPNGARITSSLQLGSCRGGDIANANGYLRCNGGGGGGFNPGNGGNRPGFGAPLPQGSYQTSCRNSFVQGATLTATCANTNGGYNTSSLAFNRCRPGTDIANINGRLNCLDYR